MLILAQLYTDDEDKLRQFAVRLFGRDGAALVAVDVDGGPLRVASRAAAIPATIGAASIAGVRIMASRDPPGGAAITQLSSHVPELAIAVGVASMATFGYQLYQHTMIHSAAESLMDHVMVLPYTKLRITALDQLLRRLSLADLDADSLRIKYIGKAPNKKLDLFNQVYHAIISLC